MAQIRGPGIPLPPDSAQNTGRPGAIVLPSGGQYVIPQGDYIIATGEQTVLQWYDPNNLLWRGFAPPQSVTSITTDGGNYRLVNLSGVCVGASITNAGSGGTNGIGPSQTGSTVTFAAPGAGGVTATAQGYVIVGGSVQAPTVTQGGSGFLVPPAIIIDPPPQGGVQATATATISAAGVITGITMVNVGAGYTSSPNFYILPQPQFSMQSAQYPGGSTTPGSGAGAAGAYPPPGLINPANAWPGSPYQANLVTGTSGALLTPAALTGSGTLTGIVMTAYGSGYAGNTTPAITFGGTSLGAAAATAIMSYCITGTTAAATGGTGFIVGAGVVTSLGLVAATNNNNTFSPRPARGIITNANGSFTVEDPGFGLQGAALVDVGGTALATVTNTQYGGKSDVSVIQSSVNS